MSTQQEAGQRPRVLLGLSDAAYRLSLSRRTLQSLIAQKKIPVVRVSPRRIAIDPTDLDRYIDR